MATMLQNNREERLAYIEERIKQYNVRFPVAAISEMTRYHKGHVSKILAGKSDITDDFLTKFESAFPNKLHSGNLFETKQLLNNNSQPPDIDITALYKELLAEKEARRQEAEARLKKEEDRYDKLFIVLETNLKELYERTLDILSAQHVGAAYQMFWIDRWAEKEAAGDNKKTEQLVKAYRKEVADKLMGKKEKSIP